MKLTTLVWGFSTCVLLLSCTKEREGITDIPTNSPRLLTASTQPAVINVDTDTLIAVPLGGGDFRVTISLAARAIDLDGIGDIGSLNYTVVHPAGHELAAGSIDQSSSSGDTALYASSISFTIQRIYPGLYQSTLWLSDRSNLQSNTFVLSTSITRANSRPSIFGLTVPDSVQRPATGSLPLGMAVSANDSDGLGDIASIFFRSVNSSNPNFEFVMVDDGNLAVSGDSSAGDGRFSTIIPLPSNATLGTREFRFWARDRTGGLSDSLSHFITVLP